MTLEEIRDFFAKDLYATEVTGIVIEEAGMQKARCSLKLTEKHRNAVGGVMGGVLFTMADFTFAVAANTDQPTTVSISSNIQFLASAKGEVLTSEAKLLHDGRTTCAYMITITDETGRSVASVTISGMKLNK